MGSGLEWDIAAREEEGEESPPAEAPTAIELPSESGGETSSSATSVSQGNGQSPTGSPALVPSVISDQEISAA
jgi:hypothetical protein